MKKIIRQFIDRHVICDEPADAPPSRLDALDYVELDYVGRHRMFSDWHNPDGEVRFMTHVGELCYAGKIAGDGMPFIIATRPAGAPQRTIEFGPAWDEADDDEEVFGK